MLGLWQQQQIRKGYCLTMRLVKFFFFDTQAQITPEFDNHDRNKNSTQDKNNRL